MGVTFGESVLKPLIHFSLVTDIRNAIWNTTESTEDTSNTEQSDPSRSTLCTKMQIVEWIFHELFLGTILKCNTSKDPGKFLFKLLFKVKIFF